MKMIQTDWLQRLRDGVEITSAEMQHYVNKLNRVAPSLGESKQEFTAPEVANVLFGDSDTKGVYALIEAGEIGFSDFGTGSKRRGKISRHSVYDFLKRHCKDAGQL